MFEIIIQFLHKICVKNYDSLELQAVLSLPLASNAHSDNCLTEQYDIPLSIVGNEN